MIECKYKGSGKSSGNEDIQSIAGAYNIARTTNLVHGCIIVTNNEFTLQAKEAAISAGIILKTKQQLIEELIDFSSYFNELTKSYEQEFGVGTNSWYIKNKARKGEEDIEDLDIFIKTWAESKSKKPIVIKGGYGTGKSSFCKHFAVNYYKEAKGLYPIIIHLREFQKTIKIESLVREFLDKEWFSDNRRFDVFWKMYKEGKILLLFDGFDEMTARVDASVIEANLLEIEKFSKEVGNVIVTCRPEYFISANEDIRAWLPKNNPVIDRMANYESIELKLWDKIQIHNYIEKKFAARTEVLPMTASEMIKELEKISKDSDITSRAVHLDIAIRMLPYMIENDIPITRANLYKTYIYNELQREVIKNKRLRTITDTERLELLKNIAYKNTNTSFDLNFDTAASIVQDELSLSRPETESATRDFLNRSFLYRNGDIYEFAHRSVCEYLIALKIFDFINNKKFDFLEKFSFSSAISGITLELFGGVESFMLLVDKLEISDNEKNDIYYRKVHFVSLSLVDVIFDIESYLRIDVQKIDFQVASFMHDIKNNAQQILSISHLLKESNNISQKWELHIQQSWNKLIENFAWLNSFKSNNKNVFLSHEALDIIQLLESIAQYYPKYPIKISGRCSLFRGNKVIVTRIFENLIKNAIEEIEKIRADEPLLISIEEGYIESIHFVNLKFTNKIGQNQRLSDMISHLFDFGFTTKSRNHGFGLFSVKSLVELHRGNIDVQIMRQTIRFSVQLNSLDVI